MDDLTAFLNARLDEDEAAANEIHRARDCGSISRSDGDFSPDPVWCSCGYPARVLREVGAMRAIIAACTETLQGDELARFALRQLIAIWGDHPDYRPEWKP